jgi:hypothetical protein
MNKPDVTIAVDGSLFRYHPRLQIMLEATLKQLINPLNKVINFIFLLVFLANRAIPPNIHASNFQNINENVLNIFET